MSRTISRDLFRVKKLENRDILIVMTAIVYRFLLDLIYINYVYTNFAYYHFRLNYNVSYVIYSYVMALCFACYLPGLLDKKRLTDVILALLVLMYFIPYTTILCYSSQEIGYSIFVCTYLVLLIVFNKIINFEKIKFANKNFADTKFFTYLIIGAGLIAILVSGLYTGFRISFDLSEYYEYRAAARENVMPEILKYLFNWSIVGLDVGLAYCLVKKRKLLSIFVVFSNLLAFSYNGKKSVLFILIVIVFVGLFFKTRMLKKIPLAFTGLAGIAMLEVILRGSEAFVAKHFIRRMLFIPPFMGTLYYDFFSTHELDYLRASILRRFGFVSPYGNIPRHIGQVYFSNVGIMAMNANTGLCGDAFSNFGYWSLIVAPFAIILIFKVIEACAKNVDYKIQIVVAIWLAYTFVSGAYFTLLLTNGVLFLCLLMWTLSSGSKKKAFEENYFVIKN